MDVMVVVSDLGDSGATRVTLDRAARWHEGGDHVTVLVVAWEAEGSTAALPPGLDVVRATRPGAQLRTALPRALLRAVLRARRAEVVVSGTEVGFGLLVARMAASLTGRPLAVTVQSRPDRAVEDYVDRPLRPITRWILRTSSLAVSVSDGLRPAIEGLGVSSRSVVVARNSVDRRDVLQQSEAAPAVAVSVSNPTVVSSGRLEHQKGFDLLVRAHARALQDGAPSHELVVLGEGGEREALEALAAELGVADSVRLPGFTPNPHSVVARSALYVLSSRYEGFSLSLAEALACGVPCLAFDCTAGPAEVLAGGRYGHLVAEGDVTALADGIRAHLLDPSDLRDRALSAAAGADELFDPAAPAQVHRAHLSGLNERWTARPSTASRLRDRVVRLRRSAAGD
ncbi:hypothetical protein ASG36_12820 [Geodermatophilus sp. Leaf369]|uniref:glycosyltransferase n=1 Tax=Geodermatophilus sp. Leaf369 TaxID=1736354 RepID=UPI0006F56DE9|nr:glycosyltransferase [Geodermatophilus sp. Leaf369]KQS58861.1 hypothetical protein ASG36_12820 [Geodermatophilus sp. Leaf369]